MLSETFFGPYKTAPEDHHFLTGGLLVQIPQCGKVTYRIFTIYQAVETLYNVSIEDNSQLTEETAQLHLVQLKHICARITPPSAQYKPPIPTTVCGLHKGARFVLWFMAWESQGHRTTGTKWTRRWRKYFETTQQLVRIPCWQSLKRVSGSSTAENIVPFSLYPIWGISTRRYRPKSTV
jgi:hypothetical protein